MLKHLPKSTRLMRQFHRGKDWWRALQHFRGLPQGTCGFLFITFEHLTMSTACKESKNSQDFQLFFLYICSVRIMPLKTAKNSPKHVQWSCAVVPSNSWRRRSVHCTMRLWLSDEHANRIKLLPVVARLKWNYQRFKIVKFWKEKKLLKYFSTCAITLEQLKEKNKCLSMHMPRHLR